MEFQEEKDFDKKYFGNSEEHVQVSNIDPQEIDLSLDLQEIRLMFTKDDMNKIEAKASENDLSTKQLLKQIILKNV